MNNSVGQAIAHYRIEKILGQGGMGSAFLAFDTQLKRRVALKLMHPHLASNSEFQQRFLQEAQAAAALDHPNIIRIFNADYWQGYLYIVMELVNGGSLRDYQRHLYDNGKVLTLTQTISMISQVADGLDYAHSQGMIHRDIKPDNILLKPATGSNNDAFRAIITDFGLAKLAEGGVHSMSGQVMGTLAYMAPEQCLGEEVDGRADTYALGIMLYELLVGKLPFSPKTITEAIKMHTQVPPPPISQVRPGLPANLERAVNRALAKKPDDRYASAAELARDLQSVNANQSDRQAMTALDSKPGVDNITTYLQSKPIAMEKPQGGPANVGEKDTLIITDPAGAQRTVTLDKASYKLGRAPDNDITLTHDSVSRNHARLDLAPDKQAYILTDLGSRNGTYLGEAKLLANIAERWTEEKLVRVGEFRLQWQPGMERLRYSQQQSVQPPLSMGTPNTSKITQGMPAVSGYQSSGASQLVAVTINPPQINLQPGNTAVVQVDLLNQSQMVQHFNVRIQGIPEDWALEPQVPIQLMPGGRGQTTITFNPPRLPTSTAGTHNFRVRVMSSESGKEITSAPGVLKMQAFGELSADFQPKRLRQKHGITRVFLTNNGNAPLGVTLAMRDREEGLVFTPPTHQLTVQPGKTEEVSVSALPRKQALLGSQQVYPFEIAVATANGLPQILSGDYLALPRFPIWVTGLASLLCVLCVASAIGALAIIPPILNGNSTATAVAQGSTATSVSVKTQSVVTGAANATGTYVVVAQTLTSIAGANSGTQTAAATLLTPPPTPTITPTMPTPTPNIPTGVCTGYPIDGNVNERSGPSTTYEKKGVLTVGSFLVFIGRNPDSTWYVANGSSGFIWVAAQFLKLNGPCDGLGAFPTPPPPVTPPTAAPTVPTPTAAPPTLPPTVTAAPPPTGVTPTLPPAVVVTPTVHIVVLTAVFLATKPVVVLQPSLVMLLPTATVLAPKEIELANAINAVLPPGGSPVESGYLDLNNDGKPEYMLLAKYPDGFYAYQFSKDLPNKGTPDWQLLGQWKWTTADGIENVTYQYADLTGTGKFALMFESTGASGIWAAQGWSLDADKNGNPIYNTIFDSNAFVKNVQGKIIKLDKGYIRASVNQLRIRGCVTVEWFGAGDGKWDMKSTGDPACKERATP